MQGKIKTKNSGSSQWFKNVSKSLGYASAELISEISPATMEFATTNSELIKETYKAMKSAKQGTKKISTLFKENDTYKTAKSALDNAIADIKTGKFYNKERQDKVFSDGEEFSMEDFSFEDDSDNEDGSTSVKAGNISFTPLIDNSAMAEAIDRQTESLLKSSKVQNEINTSISTNNLLANQAMANRLVSGLQTINDNLSLLVNFQSNSMTKYIGASIKYYDDNLKVNNEILNEYKKVTAAPFSIPKTNQPENQINDLLLSNGGLDLKAYGKHVRKQVGKAVDNNAFLAPIKELFSDDDTLKFMAASPLSFIATKVVTSLIPGMFKSAMGDMDKSFKSFFPALMMKINRSKESYNPLVSTLGEIFGFKVEDKKSIDMSVYNKGTVPFDGYTRKAITDVIPTYLRKILSSLTGQEEIAHDYETGTYKSVHKMTKEFDEKRDRTVLFEFSDVIDKLNDKLNAFELRNDKDKGDFKKGIDKFFLALSNKNHLVNPEKSENNGYADDELNDVYDFGYDTTKQRLFRQLVMTLPKNMRMKMFGKSVIDAKSSRQRFMTDAENNFMKYNASTIFNDFNTDSSDNIRDSKGKFISLKGGFTGGSIVRDKFNLTHLDYLRDIKKILLDGILVYPNSETGTRVKQGNRVSPSSPSIFSETLRKRKEKMSKEEYNEFVRGQGPQRHLKVTTPEQDRRNLGNGRFTMNDLSELSNYSDDEIFNMISISEQERNRSSKDNQNSNLLKWFGSFFKGNTQDKYNMLRERVEKVFNKPFDILTNLFKRVDSTMYSIIFGKKDEDFDKSILGTTLTGIKTKLSEFGDWFKKGIFEPLKENLFGQNGLIPKIKKSDFYTDLTTKFKSLTDYLFGKSGEDGYRSGGMFSAVGNSLTDIVKSAKYYFNGQNYTNSEGVSFPKNEQSVFSHLKNTLVDFKDNIKEYLFGKKNRTEKSEDGKGVFSSVIDGIKSGFQNFSDAIFGPKQIGGQDNKKYLAIGEMVKSVKEKAPKALSWGIIGGGAGLALGGKLGLLGSILLPGGPIGGAIVGTALGFLGQSDKFKNWLFGSKDENGERTGGFIRKSHLDFLKKNKAGILGGATLGVAKSALGLGILPSFLLPGGPIGGAVLGAGISIVTKSEKFKEMMFGSKDEDGKRQGGIITKIFGSLNKGKNKNLFGNMGAGALGGAGLGLVLSKFGLLGGMMFGPISGALLGTAAGVALTSDKWKKALFGDFDADTQLRKGGVFGKFVNWTKLEIFQPLKLQMSKIGLNIEEWFTKSIANPFKDALLPIKHEIKAAIGSIRDGIKEGWVQFKGFLGQTFEKFVGVPFGQFMKDKVLDPLKKFFWTILSGGGKIIGSVISAPFKAMLGLSNGLTKKHMQQGLNAEMNEVFNISGRKEKRKRLDNIINERYISKGKEVPESLKKAQEETKLGFFGAIGKLVKLNFSKDSRYQAQTNAFGASYLPEMQREISERNARQNADFALRRQHISSEEYALNSRRGIAEKSDYDNFTTNAKGERVPVNHIYDTSNVFKEDQHTVSINTQNKENSTTEKSNPSVVSNNPTKNLKENSTVSIKENTIDSVPNKHSIISLPVSESVGTTKTAPTVLNSKRTATKSLASDSSLLARIASDVKIIAQEVKGQLNGVGSNVYKIRKIVQKNSGVGDEDLTGSANKDRDGLFSKIRKALYRPLDSIKEAITKPFVWVGQKIAKAGEIISNAAKSLLKIPVAIAKGVWNFTKEIGNIAKEGVKALFSIPVQVVKAVGTTLKIAHEGIKAIAPAIGESLKGVAKLFSGALQSAGYAAIGFGKGLGEVALSIGQTIGETLYQVGSSLGKAVSGITEALFKSVPALTSFVFKATESVVNFTFKTINMVGEKLLDVGNTLLQIFTSPLKFLGNIVGKAFGILGPQKVELVGGHVDYVREVGVVTGKLYDTSKKLPSPTNLNQTTNESISKVYIQGIDSSIIEKIYNKFNNTSTPNAKDYLPKFGSKTANNSFFEALQMDDIDDEKRDEEKAKEQLLLNNQKTVSQKTASNIQAMINSKKEKEFTTNNAIQQTNLLGKLVGLFGQHKESWDGIFSKKGLITGGLLLALPLLIKLFKKFMGNDNSGFSQNLIGDLTRGAAFGLEKGVDNFIKPISEGIGKGKKFIGNAIEHVTNFGKKIFPSLFQKAGTEAVGKSGKKLEKGIAKGTEDGIEKLGSISIKTSEEVLEETKMSQVEKIMKVIKDMTSKIFELLEKKCGPNVKPAFKKITANIAKVFSKEIIIKTLPKWLAGIAKIAGAASTLFLSDVAWATWGAISGAVDAAHLFQVDSNQVDWIMRVVSSAINALLNVSWFFLIQIANDIFAEITGVDFIKMIASSCYKAMASEEKGIKLESAQANFEQKAKNSGKTMSEYNDEQNATLGGKITKGVKKGWNNFTTNFGYGITELRDTAKNIRTNISEKWNGLKNGVSNIASKGYSGAVSFAKQTTIGRTYSGFTNDKNVRKNLGITDDGQLNTKMRVASGVGEGLESLSFGLIKSEETAKVLNGLMTNIYDNWVKVKEKVTGEWDEFSKKVSEFWKGVTDGITKIWEGIKESVTIVWTNFKNGCKVVWEGVTSVITNAWKSVKETVSIVWDNFNKGCNIIWQEISDAISVPWNKVKETVTNIWDNFGGTGIMQATSDSVTTAWDNIKKSVSTLWDKTTDSVNEAGDKILGFFNNMGSMFLSPFKRLFNYFKNSSDDSLTKEGYTLSPEGANGPAPVEQGGNGEPTTINNFSYYSQSDPQWGNSIYDHSSNVGTLSSNPTISARGCGPTSMAMVASQLTGRNYQPPMFAQLAQNNGYSTSAGTSWGFFDRVAQDFNFNEQVIDPKNDPMALKIMLSQGIPVILSGKRTMYGQDQSPFTTGGHYVVAVGMDGNNGVKINDPRGANYSKTYDINKVINETAQGWAFKYGGGPLPDVKNPSLMSALSTSSKSTWKVLDDLSETLGIFTNLQSGIFGQDFMKDVPGWDWGLDETGTPQNSPYASNLANINIDFIPKNLQDRILKKTTEETIKHESSGNYALARNDISSSTNSAISPSLGVMQWRGGYAKSMMQKMYELMPSDSEAKYFAKEVNWTDNSPWSDSEQKRLSNFLSKNFSVTKKVQDSMSLEHVQNTNLANVYKYGVEPKKITDPRSIVFLADFANTGPGLVSSFMEKYSPTNATGVDEFKHFYKEFRSKSYWGDKSIYSSRMDSLYNDLINWDAEQGGNGNNISVKLKDIGGNGEFTDIVSKNLVTSNISANRSSELPMLSKNLSPEMRSYIYGNQSSTNKQILDTDKIVEVLKEIASNTGTTSNAINDLVKKESVVNVVATSTDSKQSPIIITQDNTNNNVGLNPFMQIAKSRQENKNDKDYAIAKAIAKGRK